MYPGNWRLCGPPTLASKFVIVNADLWAVQEYGGAVNITFPQCRFSQLALLICLKGTCF